MNIVLGTISSIIPVLLILMVIYSLGEVKKQPIWLLVVLFLGGILSWIMVRYISRLLGNDIYRSQVEISDSLGNKGFFLVSFGIIALIEEISKYVVVSLLCFKNKYFKNPYDAIMYAVCISLGFAFIENIMYINNYGMGVAVSRALFSIPAHASFGIIMGYFLGLSKMSKDKKENSSAALTGYSAFFIPFLFHGAYDFILNFSDKIIYYIFIIFVLLMYGFVIYLLFKLNKIDEKWLRHRKKDDKPVYEARKHAHKNIYYDVLYNDEDNNSTQSNIKKDSDIENNQVNWVQAESKDAVYDKEKIEMNMFRDDKN